MYFTNTLLSVFQDTSSPYFLLTLVLIVVTSSIPLLLMLRREFAKTWEMFRKRVKTEQKSVRLLLFAIISINIIGAVLL